MTTQARALPYPCRNCESVLMLIDRGATASNDVQSKAQVLIDAAAANLVVDAVDQRFFGLGSPQTQPRRHSRLLPASVSSARAHAMVPVYLPARRADLTSVAARRRCDRITESPDHQVTLRSAVWPTPRGPSPTRPMGAWSFDQPGVVGHRFFPDRTTTEDGHHWYHWHLLAAATSASRGRRSWDVRRRGLQWCHYPRPPAGRSGAGVAGFEQLGADACAHRGRDGADLAASRSPSATGSFIATVRACWPMRWWQRCWASRKPRCGARFENHAWW